MKDNIKKEYGKICAVPSCSVPVQV